MKIELEMLSKKIVSRLREKNLIISTIESCTGGGLASAITDIQGASNVIKEAYVTYSNEAKIKNVGVDKNLIDRYGVVSKEVAIDMTKKLMEKTGCDIALATTGNLGPDVLEGKEVGLVYIGYAYKDNVDAIECHIKGDRLKVKEEVIYKALDIVNGII